MGTALALLLAGSPLTAAAGAPVPRAPGGAQLVLHSPNAEALQGLSAFLRRIGEGSALLSADAFLPQLAPVVEVDLSRPADLQAVGLHGAGWVTVSSTPRAMVFCGSLKDRSGFERAAKGKLAALGEPVGGQRLGAAWMGARSQGSVVAGAAVKKDEVCTFRSTGGGEEAGVADATSALARQGFLALGQGLPAAPLYAATPGARAAVEGDARGLTVAAVAEDSIFGTGGPSPFADTAPSGAVFLRGRLAPAAKAQVVRWAAAWLARVCRACEAQAIASAAAALAPLVTGNFVVRVDRLQLAGDLTTSAGQFFAVRHALLAELDRPEQAKAVLARLSGPWLARSGEHLSVTTPRGELLFGVMGSYLYLGNDTRAVRTLTQVLPSAPGRQPHGAQVVVDPSALAASLPRVSLMDALSSPGLAPLAAAVPEVLRLLRLTQTLEATVDGRRIQARWLLHPARSGTSP